MGWGRGRTSRGWGGDGVQHRGDGTGLGMNYDNAGRRWGQLLPPCHSLVPIHKIIKFKIATITFKVLKNRQPSYLLDLLQPHNPQRSLRSSDKLLLDTPKIKTALATRSFSHAAPSVWNSLPFDLRNSSSLHSFTTHLKTHLFPP